MPDTRPAIDLSGGQAGDLNAHNVASHIENRGVDAEGLRAILHQQTEFYTTLVTAYERQYRDVTERLGRLHQEIDIWQRGEQAQRQVRQGELDRALDQLRELVSRQERGQVALRWGLLGLVALWIVGLAVLAWLIYDRYALVALIWRLP